MPGLLVNIDVPDIAAGEAFYTRALGLRGGRRATQIHPDFMAHNMERGGARRAMTLRPS